MAFLEASYKKPPFFQLQDFLYFLYNALEAKENLSGFLFFRYFHFIQAGLQMYVIAPENELRKYL